MSDTTENLTPLKRALLTLDKLQRKLEEYERREKEPIAIIGMGCRAPGGVIDPDSFWQLLREGVDAITETPHERWSLAEFFDAEQDAPGKMYTRYGGFLRDIDKFDAAFFGITPREAVSMDPQQRLLLETSWEALERAGQTKARLMGSRTGVFMGVCFNEYAQKHLYSGEPERIDGYSFTGIAPSVLAGRLSYALGLQGPSLAVDTACSSSLVTVHLACQSLRRRESDLALAGGVNLILTPENTIYFCKAGAMSPEGRCKTFDASADGYVRGEGCGVLVLKRLSDAIKDNDTILALIRGSAVNQDGRSNGLTAPNGPAQERVMREALANAGVSPHQVGYVEAHGTGTPLGDPIEAHALGNVYREGRSASVPLFLGSVKTNFGHLEGAAGVMGLIKAALVLQRKQIPPHLHFKRLNPLITLDDIPARLPLQLTEWTGEEPRFAAVSSFGISGTNAHVVLGEQLSVISDQSSALTDNCSLITDHCLLLPLSARASEALLDLVRAYREFIKQTPHSLREVCFTASLRRTHHEYRTAFVFNSAEEVAQQLENALLEDNARKLLAQPKVEEQAPRVAFIFSGQGPQWFAMGRALLRQEPVFRQKLEACDALLGLHAPWSLLEELQREEVDSRLEQTEIAQPAIFALQVALAELWRAWGIVPEAVLGHSVGEVAAAHVAGALSLEEAVVVIYHRGRLMQAATGLGKMAQVELPVEEVRRDLAAYHDRLSVAAINSPSTTVIAGEEAALEELLHSFEARAIEVKRLRVNYAFHSAQMEPFRLELERALHGLAPGATSIAMISTVTGKRIRGEELHANYWGRNIREHVAFAPAFANLLDEQFDIFVEVSPHPVLGAAMAHCAAERQSEVTILASLRRGQEERATMLKALAALYARGCMINWNALYPQGGRCVELPSYPWQRQSYWIEDARRVPAHNHQSSIHVSSDLFYDVQWQPRARAASHAPLEAGHWIILNDCAGYGEALAAALKSKGHTCEALSVEQHDERLQALLKETPATKKLHGLVHLSSIEPDAATVAQASLPATAAQSACASLLQTLQAMLAIETQTQPRLWIITKHAQAANAEPLALAGSALWGLGRTIALEHPQAWGAQIDLGNHTPAHAAELLAQELLQSDGEDQVALCADQRLVARLQRAQVSPHTQARIHADRAYLITGGLGSLGLRAATWLAEKGAKHLALLSRRKFPERSEWEKLPQDSAWQEAIATLRRLDEAGVQWQIYSVEVSDAERMAEVFATMRETLPPLAGVIHAAGVSSHKTLQALSKEELHEALRAKMQGAWVLHELTRESPLDFFVLYSSISAVWGAKELGHYAAANHFLDALAHYRRALQLPALSVNWGPWHGGGMASEDYLAQLQRAGIAALPTHEAFAALNLLLQSAATQITVAKLEWPRFKEMLEVKNARPLLANWSTKANATQQADARAEEWRRQLQHAEPEPRRELLAQRIQQEAASILGLPASKLDPAQGFFLMGMDSIMAVELKSRLEKSLGVSLPRTAAFEHPSINKLAAHLCEKFFTPVADAHVADHSAQNGATQTVALAEIQSLTEDELAAMVDAELARLGR